MFVNAVLAVFAWFFDNGYEVIVAPREHGCGIIARHPEDLTHDSDFVLLSADQLADEWVSIRLEDGWSRTTKTTEEVVQFMDDMYLTDDLIHKANVSEILYRMSGDFTGVANEIVWAAFERADNAVKALL